MSQYKTGTVSVTTGDATVTGTNTLWLSNVTAGDSFTVAGTGVTYEVASVASDTALELTANYAGATASGQSYAITRDFTANYDIPELSQGDIETATVWTRGVRKIDSAISAIGSDYYNTGNILGTVSQSSGVPTGAIIERGSNANGEYVKFADGTMICTKKFTDVTTDVATGNIYTKSVGQWTFPSAFFSSPYYVGSARSSINFLSGSTAAGTVSTLAITAIIAFGPRVDSQGDIHSAVIGRWF